MHHVAIMKKSWGLIAKILSGEKTIESRWYQTRRVPWNRIEAGDAVFFKNSGEKVVAKADVEKVLQLEMRNQVDIKDVIKKYGKQICLVNKDAATWGRLPRYCILIFLKNPKKIDKPFEIDKTGFGMGAAWVVVDNIEKIRKG